jgi:hypothetical protein
MLTELLARHVTGRRRSDLPSGRPLLGLATQYHSCRGFVPYEMCLLPWIGRWDANWQAITQTRTVEMSSTCYLVLSFEAQASSATESKYTVGPKESKRS